METIIGLFKTEAIRPGPFHTGPLKHLGDVEFTTMAWVDWFGACTPPSACSPAEAEAAHYAATTALCQSRSQYENGTEPVTVH